MWHRGYIIITTLLLCSCGLYDSRFYSAINSTEEYFKGRVGSFIYTYPNKDTLSLADLTAFIRHDMSYKYQNIAFEIKIVTPESVEWRDSVVIAMRDSIGGTIGRRNVSLYNVESLVIKDMIFRSIGSYVITITPVQKDIKGVTDIGVQIERLID